MSVAFHNAENVYTIGDKMPSWMVTNIPVVTALVTKVYRQTNFTEGWEIFYCNLLFSKTHQTRACFMYMYWFMYTHALHIKISTPNIDHNVFPVCIHPSVTVYIKISTPNIDHNVYAVCIHPHPPQCHSTYNNTVY